MKPETSRKKNLLIFLIVIIIISITPLSIAGVTLWDISGNYIFFRGSGEGPINVHDQSSASKIQIVDGIVEFSDFSILAGNIDFVGFNASANANITALAVGEGMVAYNIDANNGVTTTTTVKVPPGTFDVDVDGEDSFNYNPITELVTVRELHGLETKQIIIYFNRTSEGNWFYYNLTSINVTTGIHDVGDVSSTLDIDGDTYNCSEVVGAPGYVLEFEWTEVDQDAHCLWVTAYIFYDGVSAHTINVDLWNVTSTAWVTIGTIYDMVDFEWVNSSIYDLRMPNDFINSTGAVRGRFYHASAGNINDDIHTDFLKLYAFIQSDVAAIIITEDNFFWIFIAIVLSIITALLVWMKYGDNNN